MTEAPTCVWPVAAELGEGPVWANDALWFVDIKRRQVHRFEPSGGGRRSWDAPEQIGFLFPAAGGGFVAGLQSGLHRFAPDDGTFAPLCTVEPDRPGNRLNDGTVDRSGRLWFGTMDDGERSAAGAYYRFARGELAATGLGGIAITNGPAISPDGDILYWVDTLGGTVSACAIVADGGLGESRQLIAIPNAEGHPDGPTVDSEGAIWIALYGGSEARRYSPAGELLQRVRFPVPNITKLAFGGDDLRTVYATTARHLMSAEARDATPEAGGLFAFRSEVSGLPCPAIEL